MSGVTAKKEPGPATLADLLAIPEDVRRHEWQPVVEVARRENAVSVAPRKA